MLPDSVELVPTAKQLPLMYPGEKERKHVARRDHSNDVKGMQYSNKQVTSKMPDVDTNSEANYVRSHQ